MARERTLRCFVCLLSSLTTAALFAADADWPQWRGPNRDGVATDSPKLLDVWPTNGPARVWKSEFIPSFRTGGAGSPVVADGKVFLYVSWYHPVGGGNEMRPITAELLNNWGWLADLPEDLARKIEDARASTNRPNFRGNGYPWYDWPSRSKKEQMDAVPQALKDHPEMEAYVKGFMATLDPAVSAKYGDYIQWRICALNTQGPEDRTISWDHLKKLKACEKKGYATWLDFLKENQRNGEEYGCWTAAWEQATESMSDSIVCLDAAAGKTLWKKDFPAKKVSIGWGLSPSGTPAIWNGKCYVAGIMGLYCLSVKDGALLWQAKEGGNTHASVLVANGVVVGGWPLSAYDAESGKKLWYTGDARAGGTPVLWSSGGKNYIIAGGSWGKTAYCIDMETWKIVWEIKKGDIAQSTPVIVGDILCFQGGGAGSCAYKITPEKAELLWKSPVSDGIESFVVYQDHIYMDVSNHRAPEVYCLSLKTGETKWKNRSPGGANICSSPILADGKIIMPTGVPGPHSGFALEMIQPSPEKYISLGTFNPEMAQCSSPAFAGGKLYLRLWDGVACYDLRAK